MLALLDELLPRLLKENKSVGARKIRISACRLALEASKVSVWFSTSITLMKR